MEGIVFISLYKSAALIKRLQLMAGLRISENLILMCPSGCRCFAKACNIINNFNYNNNNKKKKETVSQSEICQ